MANPEHAYWFRQGVEQWNEWRVTNPGVIPDLSLIDGRDLRLDGYDLRGAVLRGAELGRVSLVGVNLASAELSHANMAAADLCGAELSGSDLTNVVLVDANLTKAVLDGAKLVGAALSNAQLSHSSCRRAVFVNATAVGVLMIEADMTDARLDGASFEGALLKRARLDRAALVGANMKYSDCSGASGVAADFTDADFQSAVLTECVFLQAVCRRTALTGANLERADFSHSVFDGIDFQEVDLSNVVLFSVQVTNVQWTFQMPSASWLGTIRRRSIVPGHPIQDVLGLPPALRRAIADSQYLLELERAFSSSMWRRLLFRSWGLTSAFGQSMIRWTVCSLCIALLFAAAYMSVEFAVPVYTPLPAGEISLREGTPETAAETLAASRAVRMDILAERPGFLRGLYLSVIVFTTLGFSDMVPISDLGRTLIAIEVIVGYVMLGALLAILANKLARLA